jgi:hypothetical protein
MLKPKLTIVKTVDRATVISAAMQALEATDVLVGIPAEKAPRTSAQAKGTPITNAAIGYISEYGLPSKNIPARPNLIPGVRDAQRQITDRFMKVGVAALEGKPAEMLAQFHAAGMVATLSVKRKIVTGPFIPLAAATLSARRRRGHTGTKPLIETGQFLNAHTYVLRRRK